MNCNKKYFARVTARLGYDLTFYLPLFALPIVNGTNEEPKMIDASDVDITDVRVANIGETGVGRKAKFETLYNYIVVHAPAQMCEGEMYVIIKGTYGQVCINATIVATIAKNKGDIVKFLDPYISPIVGDCAWVKPIMPKPLCFTNTGNLGVGLGFNVYNDNEDEPDWLPNLEVSYNGIDWREVTEEEFRMASEGDYPFALMAGAHIYFRGKNPDGFNHNNDDADYNQFVNFVWSHEETSVKVDGDIMSLIDYEEFAEVPSDFCFTYIFGLYDEDASAITDASGLIMQLSFNGCEQVFSNAFCNCYNLQSAPALPATALADSCYFGMFSGCTSLSTAPALPATALADSCYSSMFQGCTSLKRIEMMAIERTPTNATTNWVQGVPTTTDGVFVQNAQATWSTRGNSGIPNNWQIVKR